MVSEAVLWFLGLWVGGREGAGGREGDLRKLHVKWNNDNNYEPPTDDGGDEA